jgi:hypothetical protein
MTRQIAIIGAGMAGLAAAHRFRDAGHAVTLFDKSRGLGGRMATRRAGALQFDHGAQYFTARGERFRALVDGWLAGGQVGEWDIGSYVGMPGMSAPARAMAAGCTIVAGSQIASLHRDDAGWSIHDAGGPVATPGNGSFTAAILAVPAPQAIPLAASAGIGWSPMQQASYAPCWALMLAFDESLDLPSDRMRPEHAAIGWIARDSSKPGRSRETETVVVHATPDWSRANLEDGPGDVAPRLLAAFRDLSGIAAQPGFIAAHRWRYALVERTAGQPFLWDEATNLGACGDWCLGPRVEAAFESGDALAEVMLANLA